MTVHESDVLVGRLAESGLLSEEQVGHVREVLAADRQGLAERLVQSGWVTAWQIRQLLAGRTRLVLAGRYRLLDKVARGGMATVLRAADSDACRMVAVKVLRDVRRHDPAAVSLFVAECRLATTLDHPHIVHGLAAGCEDGRHFLVMDLVPGPNLKTCLWCCGRLPVDWSCECCRQLAEALQYTYERGLFHGDLKPANVVLPLGEPAARPHVKLLDLGVSGLADRFSQLPGTVLAGFAVGTPDYMAPERFRGVEHADVRSDVFSLGCTLFELLTGRLPFRGTTTDEKFQSRLGRDVPRAGTLVTDVPPELDEIIARMLAPLPRERFQTPADVAAALAPFGARTSESIQGASLEAMRLLQSLKWRDPWDGRATDLFDRNDVDRNDVAEGTTQIASRDGPPTGGGLEG